MRAIANSVALRDADPPVGPALHDDDGVELRHVSELRATANAALDRLVRGELFHHAALRGSGAWRKDAVTSTHDRIAWLESDLRTLRVHLEAVEQLADRSRWLDNNERAAAKRDERYEREDMLRDIAQLKIDVAQAHSNIWALQADATAAARILNDRIVVHTLVLWVVGFVVLAEAIAIALLWRAG